LIQHRDPKTTLPPPLTRSRRIEIVRAALKVTEGPDGGQRVDPLVEHTIIGRDPWCDLVMADPRVSRQHCEIIVGKDSVLVRDLGSSNGTVLGDIQVVEAFVQPNDVIRIGDSAIRVSIQEGRRRIRRTPLDPTGSLIGSGPDMRRIFSLMTKAAPHEFPVAIYGEQGVGKTSVARAIASMGLRAQGPFVVAECLHGVWEDYEHELFGVARGQSSETRKVRHGLFHDAQGGSIELANVDEMSMYLQHRILEVLDHGTVRPVGSPTGFEIGSRVFASADRPLEHEVAEGRFSRHLHQHFSNLEFMIPPLRDRREDIPTLAAHFLAVHTGSEGADEPSCPYSFSVDALRRLSRHSWPGNVAELDQVVARAVTTAEGTILGAEAVVFGSWDVAKRTSFSPEGEPL